MFQFLFKYPSPVFTKGHFVLLGSWPAWLLPVFILLACRRACSARIFAICAMRRPTCAAGARLDDLGHPVRADCAAPWLLWRPAMVVSELSSQQNIIAVVVDDSRSMSIADSQRQNARSTRPSPHSKAECSPGLQSAFRRASTRSGASASTASTSLQSIAPVEPATHLGDGLKQLAADTADLPIGAIAAAQRRRREYVGPGRLRHRRSTRSRLCAIAACRCTPSALGENRSGARCGDRGRERAASAAANARVATTVSLMQHGYAGQKATLTVRDGAKTLRRSARSYSGPTAASRPNRSFSQRARRAQRALPSASTRCAGEENLANNAVTRPILVSDAKRRILYIEGEPRWEYKFIRRAEDDDPTVQIVSMLRTSENKIYRQGISDPERTR